MTSVLNQGYKFDELEHRAPQRVYDLLNAQGVMVHEPTPEKNIAVWHYISTTVRIAETPPISVDVRVAASTDELAQRVLDEIDALIRARKKPRD